MRRHHTCTPMVDCDPLARVGGTARVLALALGSGALACFLAAGSPSGMASTAAAALAGIAMALVCLALWGLQGWRKDVRQFAQDANERVLRAESALRHLREVLDELPSGLEIYDSDDRLLLYNKRLVELYPWIGFETKVGCTFESILRESISQGRVPNAEGREEQWLAQRLSLRGTRDGPILQSLRGGKWINTYERRTPSSLVVGVRLEVTDLVRKSRELEDSQARLQAIINSAAAAIVSIDQQGLIIEVNAAASQLFGCPVNEILGQPLSRLIPNGPAADAGSGVPHPLRPLRNAEVQVQARDGQVLQLHLSISEIHSAGGDQFVAIITDLTQGKRAEEARQKDELLEAENRQIQEANRLKSQFLANMSHEIRTPLNAMLGLAQIGGREQQGHETGRHFQGIAEAGHHLLSIVDDILDFSKLEAGKLNVERRPFSLSQAVDSAIELFADRAAAKGLALSVRRAPDLPDWVEGDSLRLKQVLVNLLGNAVKFTDVGGVELHVSAHDDRVAFEVADTGIGMEDAVSRRLFQPFEQADSSTTRRFGGTGLGLAISHDLARLMGGEIQVQSQPGQGSTFTLYLPLRTAAPLEQSAAGAAGAGRRLAGLRVLAAEDNEVNRLILRAQLEAEGCTVEFACNGIEALDGVARAGASAFDAVLMDIQMPVMDGFEATRRLHEAAPGLPVIGVTAHAMPEERERCLAAGMVDHVAKPVDLDRLVACLLRHATGMPSPEGSPGGP